MKNCFFFVFFSSDKLTGVYWKFFCCNDFTANLFGDVNCLLCFRKVLRTVFRNKTNSIISDLH